MFPQISYPLHDSTQSCWTSNLNGVFFPLDSGDWTVNWLFFSNQDILSNVLSTILRKRNSPFSSETTQTRAIGKRMLSVISSARTHIHRQNIKELLCFKRISSHMCIFSPQKLIFYRILWPEEQCVTNGIFFGGEWKMERHSQHSLPESLQQLDKDSCGLQTMAVW